MPGPTQPWDQSDDPRESTVDLPRIDLAGLTDYLRGVTPAGSDREKAPPTPERATSLEPLPDAPPRGRLTTPAARAEATGPPEPAAESRALPLPLAAAPVAGVESEPAEVAEIEVPALPPAAIPAPAPVATVPARRLAADSPAVGRPAGFAQAARPPAGSMADLRSRLARLPDGHPSSPYDDGGQTRPLPTRLRQLELGLPGPGREPANGATSSAAPDHAGSGSGWPRYVEASHAEASPVEASHPDASPVAADPPPDRSVAAEELATAGPLADARNPAASNAYGRHSQPDQSRNGVGAGNAEDEAAAPASGHDTSDLPAERPMRPEPYAAGRNGRARYEAGPSSPTDALSLGPWQASDATRRSSLGGLGSLGAGNGNGHHQRGSTPAADRTGPGQQDAARRETVQHRAVPPDLARPEARPDTARSDTTRSDDSRLDAGGSGGPGHDLRALVDRTLAACRAAEGRNVFGSYGSSGLTPAIRRVAAQLPVGGLAPDSEAESLKSADRFAAKLARLIARHPGRSPAELAASISDAVRYAFAFDAADYTEGAWLVHRKLKSQGFELEARRNRWESPEHKGIFTRWRDPAHGLAFEVQFHTTASWAVLLRTHDAYVRITDSATSPSERAKLRARQVTAAAAAPAPPNCTEIGDFLLEPR
jgi:hypothetical protein